MLSLVALILVSLHPALSPAVLAGEIERVENPAYPGYLFKPKGATGPLPGILLLHGSEGAWGDYWGPQNPVGEEAPAPFLAKKFAEAGFAAYALAYFDNHHTSPAPVHVPKELAFIDLEYTYKALKWFKEAYSPGQRLVLLGHSRGAEQSLLLAGLLADDKLVPPATRVLPDLVIALSPSHMVHRGISDTLSGIVFGEKNKKRRFDMLPAWRWGETMNSPDSYLRTFAQGFQFRLENFPNRIVVTHFAVDPVWDPMGGTQNADLTRLIEAQAPASTLQLEYTREEHAAGDFSRILEAAKDSSKNRIFVKIPDRGHSWNRTHQIEFLKEISK